MGICINQRYYFGYFSSCKHSATNEILMLVRLLHRNDCSRFMIPLRYKHANILEIKEFVGNRRIYVVAEYLDFDLSEVTVRIILL